MTQEELARFLPVLREADSVRARIESDETIARADDDSDSPQLVSSSDRMVAAA